MTGDKEKFKDIDSYTRGCVKFGNDIPCVIKGKGTIQLTNKITCENVYQVEGINYNLLSISQLNKLGYIFEFHKRKAKIHDDYGKIMGTSDKTRGNLYYLDILKVTCMFAQQEDV